MTCHPGKKIRESNPTRPMRSPRRSASSSSCHSVDGGEAGSTCLAPTSFTHLGPIVINIHTYTHTGRGCSCEALMITFFFRFRRSHRSFHLLIAAERERENTFSVRSFHLLIAAERERENTFSVRSFHLLIAALLLITEHLSAVCARLCVCVCVCVCVCALALRQAALIALYTVWRRCLGDSVNDSKSGNIFQSTEFIVNDNTLPGSPPLPGLHVLTHLLFLSLPLYLPPSLLPVLPPPPPNPLPSLPLSVLPSPPLP